MMRISACFEPALYARFCSYILAEVLEPKSLTSTLSLYFMKFLFIRGRAVDIEVHHRYSRGENVCGTAPSAEKTRDRNRRPRLRARFHFNQSACWFSWL